MIKVRLKKKLVTNRGPIQLDVDFQIQDQELVTLFGPSGAGKTTILRMMAGLTDSDEGFVQVEEEIWLDTKKNINLLPSRRKIGFVFQSDSLFPHMTVRENLQFALTVPDDKSMLEELLDLVHLRELQHRRPEHLSGGQKQRAALARAVLRRPKIFLWDEPLSALDVEARLQLQDEILEILKRFRAATFLVSHDLSEVFKLSHRVFVLEQGRIVNAGRPEQVFVQNNISGKFKFVGQVLEILKEDMVNILTIQIGNNLTKVVATDDEIQDIKIGDKIMVAAKAFNPLILKYTG